MSPRNLSSMKLAHCVSGERINMKKIDGWDLIRFDPEETDTILGLIGACDLAIKTYGDAAELTFQDPRPAAVAKKAFDSAGIKHEVVWVDPGGRGIFSCSAIDIRNFLLKLISNNARG